METLRSAFVAETAKLRVGSGLDDGTDMGPLISPRRLDRAREHHRILAGET